MYALKDGWTKEDMLKALLTRNNGTPARVQTSNTSFCKYKTYDGNRCAVGCFIPEGHGAEQYIGSVGDLFQVHPELELQMPLSFEGMSKLQEIHDAWTPENGMSLHDEFRTFVETLVA